jgi:hypothetical protein
LCLSADREDAKNAKVVFLLGVLRAFAVKLSSARCLAYAVHFDYGFDALSFNIEKHFASGKPPYPIERTLLTTTVLDLAMRSLAEGGKKQQGKALSIRYQPPHDSSFFRGSYTDAG